MLRIGATSFIFLLCLLSIVKSHFGHQTGAHSCGGKPKTEKGKSAICILQPQNNSGVKGVVAMHQPTPLDPIYYDFSVGGLGNQAYHGVHIHEFGDLTQGCQSAGPHYNPYGKTHGGRNDCNRHAGDLGNLETDGKGVAHMCFTDHGSTLFGERSIIGRSIVVHKNKDDLGRGKDVESTKTGNSGPRVSCGVIGLTSQFKHYTWNNDLKRVQKYQPI